jgi:hypothetical protein
MESSRACILSIHRMNIHKFIFVYFIFEIVNEDQTSINLFVNLLELIKLILKSDIMVSRAMWYQ